jgi:hypothetical protein
MVQALDEQDPDVADRAREAIADAAKNSAVAAGALPPGEKQALPRRGGLTQTSRVEPRLSRAAGAVAGKKVEVRCWSKRDWRKLMVEERAYTQGKVNESVLGFASAGGARLSLSPTICRDLARLAYERERPAAAEPLHALALAVATLAHESVHVSGIADEAAAECHGVQLTERAARALGVGRVLARRLKAAYWARFDEIPPLYRSAECRDGGELDLDASSSEFP